MTDPKPDRKPVFIEKIMPVTLLNEQVYYEHGGNPFKGLHRWYSRKPLSFSRASVLGSLLPADVTMEDFEWLLGLNRRGKDGLQDKTTKLYKTPPSPERIKRVQELCEQMWGTKTPTVLDAFAGGGSIPFEAARYGLNVLASDLNPVAVVTMKAAIEYPLKFGADLQVEIDQWVKWVGDEAEKRLAPFFPSLPGEKVQNYLWAHTVKCPNCESIVPLSPNWWLSKTSNYGGKGQARKVTSDWYAVKPIPNLAEKRVDFELVKGKKGKGTTIETEDGEYNPDDFVTISRGVGKCPCCGNIIEGSYIDLKLLEEDYEHKLYAVAHQNSSEGLVFRLPENLDFEGFSAAISKLNKYVNSLFVPSEVLVEGEDTRCYNRGVRSWNQIFNPRQLLTLVTYVEIINEVKEKLRLEYEPEKVEAIATYLALVCDRCADMNCKLAHWDSSRAGSKTASAQHSLNLMWNYPEVNGAGELWRSCADAFISDYQALCKQIGSDNASLWHPNLNPLVAQASGLPPSEGLAEICKLEAGATNQMKGEVAQASGLLPSEEISEIRKLEAGAINQMKGEVAQASGLLPSEEISEIRKLEACATNQIKGEVRKRKRKNLPHWELAGAVYAIGFTTQDRIELSPEARQVVLDACKFFDGDRYRNYAIVFMPDHIHWLVQPLPKEDGSYWSLTSITHSIKSYTAKQIPKVMKHIGKVWQIESYDRIVRDDGEFLDTWEYIRQNPVEAGLSEIPEAYSFFWQIEDDADPSPISLVAQASGLHTSKGKDKRDAWGKDKRDACATVGIEMASADALGHIPDQSLDAIVTDPPYYATIQYAELSDFFYVWQKRTLGDIFPELFASELTDKDREAVANPSRFRNMGSSPEVLANQDYEAKMALAFAEYYRVLRDDGVMTVQFNHKDSGAWDVLAKSLIDAGFEITASWAVSTENPQNLHQAQKNSVSSTVLLVCRKRDPNAGQAWWDDLRPDVANLVEQRAPEFEANDITGIDLYLSAFGPALNVFSRNYPILDSSGNEVRPEEAFAEARRAIANYRFYKLAQTDTQGFAPLTTWYMLAWDAFGAREFPFDEARQLALAVGGFNVADLAKTYKLIDSTSGTCKFLTPQQRHKKRAFSLIDTEFDPRYLIDALHAIITLYLEEGTIEPVRRFLKATGLLSNDLFMRSWEVALKVIPRIGDERKRIPEEKALADLWLAMDEIKAKVVYVQPELELGYGQKSLNFDVNQEDT